MKLKKSLILLAATATGVGALATAPVISAAEYSSSFSGNVRVEALSATSKSGDPDAVTTLSTGFGGDDEESSTGGDTYLQWNHAYEGENSVASGFIRFAGDGNVRINVEGSSELGNYKGDIKAEWERNGFGGVACDAANACTSSITERDQFAKLTHTGIGLYYKIGREEWFGNQKGYASDFGSYTKGYADAGGFFDTRFSGHALGWSGSGVHVALFLQRDNGASVSGQPPGVRSLANDNATGNSATSQDTVSTVGFLLGYNAGPVDVALNLGSGSTAGQVDGREQSDSSSFTELQLALTFGTVRPFLNYGAVSVIDEDDSGTELTDTNAGGWNLGVDIGLGASDLVIAYGSRGYTVADVSELSGSGFDLIWATNKDPLKVSLAFASQSATTTYDDGTADLEQSDSQYGVRLDFGF